MNYFDTYVSAVFIVKIIFIILAIMHIYNRAKGKQNTKQDKKIVFWKDRVEFIFIFMMSLLLIYLFNPRYNKPIVLDYETKLLLFLFGIVLLITAKWEVFIKESKLFQKIQYSLN
jgi:uncharacterized membrane protein YbjE (DUF340 family)